MLDSKYMAFAEAAKVGKITSVAETLGYTQSGISRLINSLEQELGFPLLIRSKSGVKLTAEGRTILPYIEKMIELSNDIERLAEGIRGVSVGEITVGTFSSVAIAWLPILIREMKRRFPCAEILVVNGNYSEIESALAEHRVDCAFVTLPAHGHYDAIPLARDRLMAVVDKADSYATCRELTPKDIENRPFIVPAEGSNYDIGTLFETHNIRPQIKLKMGDDYAAVEMVKQGLGITILPELLVRHMSIRAVRAIPLKYTDRTIGLAVLDRRCIAPIVSEFINLTMNYVKNRKLPYGRSAEENDTVVRPTHDF